VRIYVNKTLGDLGDSKSVYIEDRCDLKRDPAVEETVTICEDCPNAKQDIILNSEKTEWKMRYKQN
jgi:hypothetical protein